MSQGIIEIVTKSGEDYFRRREPGLPVWDAPRPSLLRGLEHGRRIAALKRDILSELLGSGSPLLIRHADDPNERDVPGAWDLVASSTWVVPPDLDLRNPAVDHWLFSLGNWRCYQSPTAVESSFPDAFRSAARNLLAWMESQSIDVLIDSFHDDSDWVVAVRS